MHAASRSPASSLLKTMEAASRVLGLRLCLHDYFRRSHLPLCWTEHANPACLQIKSTRQHQCAEFCGHEVHQAMYRLPRGRIHTCPFGHTEIAVPVITQGVHTGVLFAGPCWRGRGRAPRPGLVRLPGRRWLQDRWLLVSALAEQVAAQLAQEAPPPHQRQSQVMSWVHRNIERRVRVGDLAAELHLSPSRTGHLVKEVFKMTFPRLIHAAKLAEAGRLLRTTHLPIIEIALRLGYTDQSHLTNLFRRHHRLSPHAYRQRHVQGV